MSSSSLLSVRQDDEEDKLPALPVANWRRDVRPALWAAVGSFDDEFSAEQVAEFGRLLDDYEATAAQRHQRWLETRRLRALLRNEPTSWLADWWLQSYLECRDSLWVQSNVWISLQPLRSPLPSGDAAAQLVHAAALCAELCALRSHLRTHGIRQRSSGGAPLSVDQYARLFATCRLPGADVDALVTYPDEDSQHIVVALADRFYRLDVPAASCNAAHVHRALLDIATSAGGDRAARVGLLTTLERSSWADARLQLLALSPHNRHALQCIESAAFVLCLDAGAAGTPRDLDELAYHGRGVYTANRWYDKCFQLIVTADGTAAVNFDHTWGDGIVMADSFDHVSASANRWLASFADAAALLAHVSAPPPPPSPLYAWQPLTWQLDEQLHACIATAGRRVEALLPTLRLDRLHVDVGRQQLKALRVNADAFVQLCLQLAYARTRRHFGLTPELANVYETAATRTFRHGRTETARPRTAAAVHWLRDPQPSAAAFRAAHDAHLALLRTCSGGHGFDRYLFGVARCCHELGEPLPAFLGHAVMARLRRFDLSTSQNTPVYGSGFGFHVPAGSMAGIPYFIGQQHVHLSVTSNQADPHIDVFVEQIRRTMLAVHHQLRQSLPSSL